MMELSLQLFKFSFKVAFPEVRFETNVVDGVGFKAVCKLSNIRRMHADMVTLHSSYPIKASPWRTRDSLEEVPLQGDAGTNAR